MKTLISAFTLWCFLITSVIGTCPVYAQSVLSQAGEFRLPAPGVRVALSPQFNPPILKGIKVRPDNPFRFDFILDQGDGVMASVGPAKGGEAKQSQQEQLKQQATKLIKYFLASLTIPEKDLWVNLSPYEKDKIIPQSFGQTEMGRDLLAEDYMLKQITASLIYPEDEIGKKFWKRIYEEAAKKFGTTNIPVNTFNKVWIVPEKAVVYENAKAGTAYVVESKLKVMLEQDYLALSKNQPPTRGHVPEGYVSPSRLPSNEALNVRAPQGNHLNDDPDINKLGSDIIREIVIPELTREVNEGKNFAQLRQVYNSLILATWYKKKIKDSILAQVYADKKKVAGVGYNNPLRNDTELIYQRYLQAFKKGVYNYIKEEQDPITQETTPRKYFSGGVDWAMFGDEADKTLRFTTDGAMVGSSSNSTVDVQTDFSPLGMNNNMNFNARSFDKDKLTNDFEHLLDEIDGQPQTVSDLFILSNEQKQSAMLNQLAMQPGGKGVYVGFSGMLNLDMIAVRKPLLAILGGIDRGHKVMYDSLQRTILDGRILDQNKPMALRRVEFVDLLLQNFEKDRVFAYDLYGHKNRSFRSDIKHQLQEKERWIGSDNAFEFVQNMFLEGRIGYVYLDGTDVNKFIRISQWVKQNGLEVDSIYTSNIFEWLKEQRHDWKASQGKFLLSLKQIANPNSIIINARATQPVSDSSYPVLELVGLQDIEKIIEHEGTGDSISSTGQDRAMITDQDIVWAEFEMDSRHGVGTIKGKDGKVLGNLHFERREGQWEGIKRMDDFSGLPSYPQAVVVRDNIGGTIALVRNFDAPLTVARVDTTGDVLLARFGEDGEIVNEGVYPAYESSDYVKSYQDFAGSHILKFLWRTTQGQLRHDVSNIIERLKLKPVSGPDANYTGHNRLLYTHPIILKHVSPGGVILDVGVSSGITSLDLQEAVFEKRIRVDAVDFKIEHKIGPHTILLTASEVDQFMQEHPGYLSVSNVDVVDSKALPLEKYGFIRVSNLVRHLNKREMDIMMENLGHALKEGGWILLTADDYKFKNRMSLWIKANGRLKPDNQNAGTGENDYFVKQLDPLGVGIDLKTGDSSQVAGQDRAMTAEQPSKPSFIPVQEGSGEADLLRDMIVGTGILSHGGPLALFDDFYFSILPRHLQTDSPLFRHFLEYFREMRQLFNTEGIFNISKSIDSVSFNPSASATKKFLTQRGIQNLPLTVRQTFNELEGQYGEIQKALEELQILSKDATAVFPDAESASFYHVELEQNLAAFIRQYLPYVRAVRAFFSSPGALASESMSNISDLGGWLGQQSFKTKAWDENNVEISRDIELHPKGTAQKLSVQADPDLLRMALERIVSNGFHADAELATTGMRGVVSEIERSGRHYAVIKFINKGEIPAEYLERVNESPDAPQKLFRWDFHWDIEKGRQGFGVKFAARAIEKMGGQIEAHNEAVDNETFGVVTVYLPLLNKGDSSGQVEPKPWSALSAPRFDDLPEDLLGRDRVLRNLEEQMAGYFNEAKAAYPGVSGHIGDLPKNDTLLYLLKKYASPIEGKRILEIGSHDGGFLIALKAMGVDDVQGLDNDHKIVEFARKKGVPVVDGSIENPPQEIAREPYDVVISNAVLEVMTAHGNETKVNIPRLEGALTSLTRLVRPGGISINAVSLWPEINLMDVNWGKLGFDVLETGSRRGIESFIVLRRQQVSPKDSAQVAGQDRAMIYTDGRGHLKLDSFALPAVPLAGPAPSGKVTVMDETLSEEVIHALQVGGYLDSKLAFTSKLNPYMDYDRWNDWGEDVGVDGNPLETILGLDRKFSMLYGDFLFVLRQAAEEMKSLPKTQQMPINNVPGKEGELVNQVYWSVQVKTPQGESPFIVHIRNSYHQVVPVNSHREADYQIFVTSQKEYQDRGLHWDDLCGHVILKFNEGNILSNPSLEVQVGLRFRQKFPWLFGFVRERLAEQLQKSFDAANADLKSTPQGSKEYFIDESDLDPTALDDDYNNQFSSFLDNLLAVLRFDGARLNNIVAQESRYYGVKWDYRGVKLFQDVFNWYFWDTKGHSTLAKLSLEFPSLAGLWAKILDDKSSDKFGHISTWIMDRYKELKEKDNHGQLLNFKIDVARFVQTVIVQELRYIAESQSMAHVLANHSWNCWSISCLTVVLMGLWGIPGVSVVEVAQLPDGTRLPLPGGIGHAANLVWEGNQAVYVDQGGPPAYSNVRIKVIRPDTEDWEAAIDELKPGLQGLTIDRIFELYKAQNDFKRIMDKLKKCPGIGVTSRGNVFSDITGENAEKMISPLSEVILDIETLSSRTIDDTGGPVNVLALDWQFRNRVRSILNTFGRVLWQAQREVELQESRKGASPRWDFPQFAQDHAQLAVNKDGAMMGQTIKDVLQRPFSRSMLILTNHEIEEYIEEPWQEAMKVFLAKNILTLTTTANGPKADLGSGVIVLDLNSLSPENLKIAEQVGRIDEDYIDGPAITIEIPLHADMPVEEFSKKAVAIAEQFKKQKATWIPALSYEELLQRIPFLKSVSVEDLRNMYYFDSSQERYYFSKEQYLRANDLLPDKDGAMMGQKGGIDLTDAAPSVRNDASGGIKFHLDPAELEQLQNAQGFVPVIISVRPLTDLRQFLGVQVT